MTPPRVSVQATRVRPRSPQGRFRIAYWAINVSVPAMCRECLLPGNLGGDVVRPLLAESRHAFYRPKAVVLTLIPHSMLGISAARRTFLPLCKMPPTAD